MDKSEERYLEVAWFLLIGLESFDVFQFNQVRKLVVFDKIEEHSISSIFKTNTFLSIETLTKLKVFGSYLKADLNIAAWRANWVLPLK